MLPCRCQQRAGRARLKRNRGGHRPEPQSLPEGRERRLGPAVRLKRPATVQLRGAEAKKKQNYEGSEFDRKPQQQHSGGIGFSAP